MIENLCEKRGHNWNRWKPYVAFNGTKRQSRTCVSCWKYEHKPLVDKDLQSNDLTYTNYSDRGQ